MLIIITKRGKEMKSIKKLLLVMVFVSVFQVSHINPLDNHNVNIQMNEEVWPKG